MREVVVEPTIRNRLVPCSYSGGTGSKHSLLEHAPLPHVLESQLNLLKLKDTISHHRAGAYQA